MATVRTPGAWSQSPRVINSAAMAPQVRICLRSRLFGPLVRAQATTVFVTAFDFIKANKLRLGIERDLDSYDYHVLFGAAGRRA